MRRRAIERLLPSVFQRTLCPGSPLFALLEVMEDLHEPAEEILGRLHSLFNPHLTPDRFVPHLARWADLERFLPAFELNLLDELTPGMPVPTELGRLRELIAAAAYLSQWRGTARGLLLFLQTATGDSGFRIDEQVLDADGVPRSFHLRVHAPSATEAQRALIVQIIEQEKPAYVTYELAFG